MSAMKRLSRRGGAGRLAAWAWLVVAAVPCPAVEVALWPGVRDAIIAKDPDARAGRCVAADVSRLSGTAFEARTPPLAPGAYLAGLRLKLPVINHVNTAPLNWILTVSGAGDGRRAFDILLIERPGVYQEIPCRFVVRRGGEAVVSLAWQRESLNPDRSPDVRVEIKDIPTASDMAMPGDPDAEDELDELDVETELESEPPIAGLKYLFAAVDAVTLTPLGDVTVDTLETDKIRYRPGEQATFTIGLSNLAAAARALTIETTLVHDLDTVVPVDSRTVTVPAAGTHGFSCQGPPFKEKWGWAVRCRVLDGGRAATVREEYFTVHDNPWAVLMAGRGAAQFTAHITPESAAKAARDNQARYRNWVESGFWAPDEFGDFTPDTEHWWGGQGCYYGSVSGTRAQIEEGHKRGIAFAVYANIWGGDGPPAFETVRRRPDWGYASTFNTEWFERWDRNPLGTGSERRGMHVWPVTIIRHGATDEPARHHARELIAAHRTLGWDAVRYDSHAISNENARIVGIVKEVVRAEVPDFQFGYNSSVPGRDASLAAAFSTQCEGGGLIMEEGIRQYGGGGLSYGQASYEAFARRVLDFSAEARESGSHFVAIGMDKCYPNDLVYQYIFWFAANTHMCYDWADAAVANYAQFATRYAGLLWDLQVTRVADPAKWIEVGDAAPVLWLWRDYVHQRDLGGGRRQLILHLINAPLETNLYTHDDGKVPPPRANLPLTVRLPGSPTVRGVWFLTPEYDLTQERLPHQAAAGGIAFTVPRLRFWSTVVIDLENAAAAF